MRVTSEPLTESCTVSNADTSDPCVFPPHGTRISSNLISLQTLVSLDMRHCGDVSGDREQTELTQSLLCSLNLL